MDIGKGRRFEGEDGLNDLVLFSTKEKKTEKVLPLWKISALSTKENRNDLFSFSDPATGETGGSYVKRKTAGKRQEGRKQTLRLRLRLLKKGRSWGRWTSRWKKHGTGLLDCVIAPWRVAVRNGSRRR